MPNFKSTQMLLLDDVFRMAGGYVHNFSDKTFGTFFREEVGIDIDLPCYSVEGGSKAKRFRYFVQNESLPAVVKAIKALWEYRQALMERDGEKETLVNIDTRMEALVSSIGGQWDKPTTAAPPSSAVVLDSTKIADFTKRLLNLGSLAPHPRGYAFEEFLRDLFDAYGLEAHKAFRNRGEQIDGSFQLDGQTYLLEAKWQNAPSDAADLHVFQGKIGEKSDWSRGLFVSYAGFSADGLIAFGRAKRIICMDGLDMHEALTRGISLDKLLRDKARKAAETGLPYVRVSDL
ncbi:hypothetical protein G6L08_00090 [Agrobacterium rhizogenes]|nr:hypothetical protein [Rhizobium rhizogenes]